MNVVIACEILAALWSIAAIEAFSNGYTIFGYVAVVIAIIDTILGLYQASQS